MTTRRPAVEAGPRKPRLRSLIDPAPASGQAGGKSEPRHNTQITETSSVTVWRHGLHEEEEVS